MSNTVSWDQLQRIFVPFEQFAQAVEETVGQSTRKPYRAKRTPTSLFATCEKHRIPLESFVRISYDTRENRWLFRLLTLLSEHLCDFEKRYATESEDPVVSMQKTLSRLSSHQIFHSISNTSETVGNVSEFPPSYRKVYHSYVILKYAICEIEAEIEERLSEVNWAERDVLVGSFGSEKQFRHNLAKKYYYAPERYFDPACFPIRYVALYQSAHFSESGILYYGEVRKIRRVLRKRIRFGVRRKNGEEGYFHFRIKEWKRLCAPIEIQDEGVFSPKFTNLFLLMHCRKTYELFHLRSERDYRTYRQLCRILAHAENQLEWKEKYPIEGGKTVWVHDGRFDLLDEGGRLMLSRSVREFLQHPSEHLDEILECVAKESTPSELPLWVIRENQAYEEKYGVPYSEE